MSVPGVDRTFCEKLLGRCEVQLDCSEVRESSDIARRWAAVRMTELRFACGIALRTGPAVGSPLIPRQPRLKNLTP